MPTAAGCCLSNLEKHTCVANPSTVDKRAPRKISTSVPRVGLRTQRRSAGLAVLPPPPPPPPRYPRPCWCYRSHPPLMCLLDRPCHLLQQLRRLLRRPSCHGMIRSRRRIQQHQLSPLRPPESRLTAGQAVVVQEPVLRRPKGSARTSSNGVGEGK